MNKLLLMVVAALALSGCLPASKEALKGEAGGALSFEVPAGYQAVYRHLVPMMRQCMEWAWIGDNTGVRADLFTDTRKAEISVEGANMLLGKRVELVVEIDAVSETASRVTVYQPGLREIPAYFKRWADGSLKTCT